MNQLDPTRAALLVLAGVATQFAVEGTAREAVDRGYRVVVLEDCCASRVREVHQFSIDRILRSLCQVTTADRFIGDLGQLLVAVVPAATIAPAPVAIAL
jgi:nicotinamidase-related amidase